MRVLVTGGAGYIGSVVAAKLAAAGHQVTVLDDLSTGHADAVPADVAFRYGTLRDDAKAAKDWAPERTWFPALRREVARRRIGPVPAEVLVSQSRRYPRPARRDARQAGTPKIVFSSTAAVYGEPEQTPIPETAPPRPTSLYGASKIAVDTTLTEYGEAAWRRRGQPALLQRGRGLRCRPHRRLAGRAPSPRNPPDPECTQNRERGLRGQNSSFGSMELITQPPTEPVCGTTFTSGDLADAHLLALGACRSQGGT